MANIKVTVAYPIKDGVGFTFHAPCNCSEVEGLTVEHPGGMHRFVFKDAHGNDLTGINNLFAAGSLIKAVLDVTNSAACIQNADTNGYIEGHFATKTELTVERSRINEFIASNPYNGGLVCDLRTIYGDNMLSTYEGTLTSNGADAHVSFKFKCKDFHGSEYWYKALPDEFTPMVDTSIPFLGKGGEYFVVTVQKVEGGGAQLCIFNYTESHIDPDITWQVSGVYPLDTLSVSSVIGAELADLRVGFDGVTYPTAGEAIRGQFGVIESALDSILAIQNNLIGGVVE